MKTGRLAWLVVTWALGAGIASPQTGSETTLAEGTVIQLELNDHLSSKLNREGDTFTASVTVPVYVSERLVVAKGSLVTGNISRIIRPGRFKGKAVMNLVFQSIRLPGRGEVPILASLERLGSSKGSAQVMSESRVEGDGSAGGDVARVAAPSLAGAGIGSLAGGGSGAAIGAGIGAAVGLGTVFTTRGKDLEIPRGSGMEIRLDRPLQVQFDNSAGGEIRQR
jgi:hypothetical protein